MSESFEFRWYRGIAIQGVAMWAIFLLENMGLPYKYIFPIAALISFACWRMGSFWRKIDVSHVQERQDFDQWNIEFDKLIERLESQNN